jgi:hypothetical protein
VVGLTGFGEMVGGLVASPPDKYDFYVGWLIHRPVRIRRD